MRASAYAIGAVGSSARALTMCFGTAYQRNCCSVGKSARCLIASLRTHQVPIEAAAEHLNALLIGERAVVDDINDRANDSFPKHASVGGIRRTEQGTLACLP